MQKRDGLHWRSAPGWLRAIRLCWWWSCISSTLWPRHNNAVPMIFERNTGTGREGGSSERVAQIALLRHYYVELKQTISACSPRENDCCAVGYASHIEFRTIPIFTPANAIRLRFSCIRAYTGAFSIHQPVVLRPMGGKWWRQCEAVVLFVYFANQASKNEEDTFRI